MKLGIEYEYVAKISNVFFNSKGFKEIVCESIAEYRSDKTEAFEKETWIPLIYEIRQKGIEMGRLGNDA